MGKGAAFWYRGGWVIYTNGLIYSIPSGLIEKHERDEWTRARRLASTTRSICTRRGGSTIWDTVLTVLFNEAEVG